MAEPGPSVLERLAARTLRLRDAEEPDELRPAAGRAGRYRIVGEIARGGIGVVFKGHDVDLGRDVAVKVLRDDHRDSAGVVERFVEEAQIGGQLQHPGIVPVYEIGLDEEGRPHFSMKLVKGRTLAALLAEREDPAHDRHRFLEIFEQVCHTIAYAHARGVVHRDLKPANVMIGAFGEVQVVDWGLAKVLRQGGVSDEKRARARRPAVSVIATVRSEEGGSESLDGSVMGTPAYMPPEQALGQVDLLDERSDVFSLGAILVEILTGGPPYRKEGVGILVQAAQCRLDDLFEELRIAEEDGNLVDLVRRCLAPQQPDRPRDASVLAESVQVHLAAVEERAAAARVAAAEAVVRAAAERRARRLTRLLTGVVLGALVLGAGVFWMIERRARARKARSSRAVRGALEEALVAKVHESFPEALAASRRAVELARDGDVAPSLVREAEEALAESARLAEAARESEAQREREERFLGRLDAIGLRRVGDGRGIDAAYAEAFVRFGIDLDAESPEQIARRLITLPLDEVAAALDRWSAVRRKELGLERARWARLLRIAGRIDPVDGRSALRDAVLGKGIAAATERAGKLEPGKASVHTLVLLSDLLDETGRHDEAVRVLRAADEKHPGHLRVHHRLAIRLSGAGRNAEALPHASAAVALRPESAPLRTIEAELVEALAREGR